MFNKDVLKPVLHSIECYAERNAFFIDDHEYTYRQLGMAISKVRTALRSRLHKNSMVGLVANDDLETYASIFALWLEGKAYVPLHPGWPLERCSDIVEQVEMDLILDSSEQTRYEGNVVMTRELTYTVDCLDLCSGISDHEIAYILFTSGSTGKPKGVMITRDNVAAFMESLWQTGIKISYEDRCLQCFDLTFDLSIQSYMIALSKGACVYTVPHDAIKYVYVANLIDEEHITHGMMPPSLLRYMEPYFEEIDATSLKSCILAAEACPLQLMNKWYTYAINTDIYDFYGPTETTINVTYYKLSKVNENKSLNGIIAIGRPMANVKAIVIDEQGNNLPAGEKGELCIAGRQVTPGYWKNEEKNREAFFIKEIEGKEMRFYRTGDLCYMDTEGDIMYSGRIDQQAKIQGFRVELGEIEHHARQFLTDKNAVCVAFDNAQQLTEIALFIEATAFDTTALMEHLRSKMPSYMIPTRTLFVPQFPLNGNDKIDRNQLKQMI